MDQPQNPNRPDPLNPPPDTAEENADQAQAPPPPLTPLAWLSQNAFYLVTFAAAAGFLYYSLGLAGLAKVAVVILGIGLLIFVHELGHFLAAKWCDVHVQTFSIGFGPALPGCSFKRGETTYKLAIIPLGGYVNMIGEGTETEEAEDYPRSFKNKSVGQRMLIISAGVIMNILLGCVLFVIVFRYFGVERIPAIAWRIEAGSPVWKKGVHTGSRITRVGPVAKPFFNDLQMEVALSGRGQEIPFVFEPRPGQGPTLATGIEPRRTATDRAPMVGVAPPVQLKLSAEGEPDKVPVALNSAAALARPLDLGPDDVILQASDPDQDGAPTPLPPGAAGNLELCRRLEKLGDAPLVLLVQRAGKDRESAQKVEVPAHSGFQSDDLIVGTTNPEAPDALFRVEPLPPDPNNPSAKTRDPFEFRRRLHLLAGKPVVVRVERPTAKDSPPQTLDFLVPPAYHAVFGMRMKMGKVAAVRDDSPAARAGVQPRDELTRLVLSNGTDSVELQDLDPLRLPFDLARKAERLPGQKTVTLTVLRPNSGEARESAGGGPGLDPRVDSFSTTLPPADWDDSWSFNDEEPVGLMSPISIPQLGVAYYVETTVAQVQPDSPAGQAGVRADDRIDQVRLRTRGARGPEWEPWFRRQDSRRPCEQWAPFFWAVQRSDYHEVEVRVFRDGKLLDEPLRLTGQPDRSWPLVDRGFRLTIDTRLQKTGSLLEALGWGVRETVSFIKQIYLSLSSLVTGRIALDNLESPIGIVSRAYDLAADLPRLMLFLGALSINLAVVNFLPIPVLDGGHMVMLLYEKLRGKPMPESVMGAATYVGLALLVGLMIFVVFQDISKWDLISRWFGRP